MLEIISPYDLSPIKTIPVQSGADIENALQTAYSLHKNMDARLPPFQRIEILEKLAVIMKERFTELVETATREGGKPLIDTRIEIYRAINGVKLASAYIGQLYGREIPMGLTESSMGRLAFTRLEPIGVVASVSAFNHPVNLIVHQTVTAIAAGCPVIIKPAKSTPLSCLALVEMFKEAGLPDGWCQVLICSHEDTEKLITDPRVKYFSFIGSAKTGWYLKSKLAPGTHCALEHGGAAPVIVEPDADLEEVIPSLLKGGFYHAGQVCVSVQKIYAHEKIVHRLKNKMIELTQKLKVGDPLDPTTEVGPLIDPAEVDRVEAWVNEAVREGAELLCGGKRISDTCYEPSILLNPSEKSKVSQKEIFGPVVCIYSYSDLDEAIRKANSLPFCFQSAIFTKDIDTAVRTSDRLNAMAVMINDHTAFRVDWMPFGGSDESGIGTGGIPYTIREMSREKLRVIKLGAKK